MLLPGIINPHDCAISTFLSLNLYMLNISKGIKTYLYFMSFPHISMTQVAEILSQVPQELTYSI